MRNRNWTMQTIISELSKSAKFLGETPKFAPGSTHWHPQLTLHLSPLSHTRFSLPLDPLPFTSSYFVVAILFWTIRSPANPQKIKEGKDYKMHNNEVGRKRPNPKNRKRPIRTFLELRRKHTLIFTDAFCYDMSSTVKFHQSRSNLKFMGRTWHIRTVWCHVFSIYLALPFYRNFSNFTYAGPGLSHVFNPGVAS